MTEKYVYAFKEGDKSMKQTLGGKGANLAEMSSIGLPVPQGFIITTQACHEYNENNNQLPDQIKQQIFEKLEALQLEANKKLGDKNDPLLVSVRSGAAISMPGMMDTVLNLGLNDETVEGLANKTQNPRFAYDSYRRFIQMFGDVVMGVKHEEFEKILQQVKNQKGVQVDTDLDTNDLRMIIDAFKQIIQSTTGKLFPSDVREQLIMAVNAVFGSWNNDRAITYRRLNNIHGLIGTAVNIQSMVFGNMGDDSGTGVCFTRNPSTGEDKFYGEFLMNAQGEDVVAGIRTPKEIQELRQTNPENYQQLIEVREKLEQHYKDMQDIEFTIQQGKLYILQTRNGKRTAQAAVKIAVDKVNQGLITKEKAILEVEPQALDQLLHKQINPNSNSNTQVLTKGLPASPGAAVGKVVFTAEEAKQEAENKQSVILVRIETSPEDIEGMDAAQGILTARGGMTSHAAVVARGMGKCCVAGCSELNINEEAQTIQVNNQTIRKGEIITLNGSTGEVILGSVELIEPELSGDFGELMKWADEARKLKIRTNADTPKDAQQAIKFGAQGIGLCRTEHMFFEPARIKAVREMILSSTKEGREKALAKILPMQRTDFYELFKVMDNKPVTIRFLDPPLHEFLPREDNEIIELANEMNLPIEKIKEKIEELHEFNPMLGHRGCRLAITYPEIAEMQSRAVFEAAAEITKQGKTIIPEVMIPLVGNAKEFTHQKQIVDTIAEKVKQEQNINFQYKLGTMIEVPRGAITADKIAEHAEFFSFGTNDLTQMGCGFSRDDSGSFLKHYTSEGIFKQDPFQSLDQEGIGELMKIAIEKAKPIKPNIKLGICGEHGGDPESIYFCHKIGLDYVSCSPYRVPIARLSAAQIAIKEKQAEQKRAHQKMIQDTISNIKNKFGETISIQDLEKELEAKMSG